MKRKIDHDIEDICRSLKAEVDELHQHEDVVILLNSIESRIIANLGVEKGLPKQLSSVVFFGILNVALIDCIEGLEKKEYEYD